ncbi:hypothetical protein WICANDRAFT_27625 [Wickerhamomyces anomalus NRRL Y-366-8]|uniref:Uncharacterized protein n=1 Tax=Wickerhamomyces anomalus (strain ATCC 58044 / CBS 1984 / NCYC 433 / NRRL Y-366-8) TaxID=683960 RepID=A0A1E3P970_WICAA|nr:uncharacterized protein WICANDRAFT_27625 [Wickerhamomyces anomalus NRRL Y-366-8]ODQ61959.1 hypothetical protein WICANDRAFT_27625 [Wickerhamomyces anomalus NRRL Y-366-8]
MKSPRNLEEFLYLKLMNSPAFHRFVRNIYFKVNGIQPPTRPLHEQHAADHLFQPTSAQKFKAYRLLFYDEWRATFGFPRKH